MDRSEQFPPRWISKQIGSRRHETQCNTDFGTGGYHDSGTSFGASLFEILRTRVGWIPSAIYLGRISQSNTDLFERVCVEGLSFTTDEYFLHSSTPLSFNSSGALQAALGTSEVAPIGSLVRLRMDVISGATFKILSLMLCRR
jgi:hypothetical protein